MELTKFFFVTKKIISTLIFTISNRLFWGTLPLTETQVNTTVSMKILAFFTLY